MGPTTVVEFLIYLTCILISTGFCLAKENDASVSTQPSKAPQQITLDLISKGLTKFTLDLDKAILQGSYNEGDYYVSSPACLQISLAMILLASNGKTFDEVSKVLGLNESTNISQNSEIFHHILSESIKNYGTEQSLNSSLPLVKFASGIFVKDGFPLIDQFKSASEQLYDSEVKHLDFAGNSSKVKEIVNNWIQNKTLNKIKEALSSPPERNTLAVLLSTLYFKGEWVEPFEKSFSRQPFRVGPNETVDIHMVKRTGYFPYYSDKELGFRIVGIPYKGSDTLMYVILPTAAGKDGLNELRKRLTSEKIDEVLELMRYKKLKVFLPKMDLSSSQSLKDSLISLGLSSLFDSAEADLSLLSPASHETAPKAETNASQKLDDTHSSTITTETTEATTEIQPNAVSGFKKSESTFRTIVSNDPIYDVTNPSTSTQTTVGAESLPKQQLPEVYIYEDSSISHYELNGHNSHIHQIIAKPSPPFVNSRRKRDGSGYPSLGIDALRNQQKLKNPGLYLSNLFHAVEISVDELGTEAAASTIGLVEFRSADPQHFKVNQPFAFFIRQNSTKSILFWGSVNKPSPSYPHKLIKKP